MQESISATELASAISRNLGLSWSEEKYFFECLREIIASVREGREPVFSNLKRRLEEMPKVRQAFLDFARLGEYTDKDESATAVS